MPDMHHMIPQVLDFAKLFTAIDRKALMSACEIALHSQLSAWDDMPFPFIYVQKMFQHNVLDNAYFF